MLCAYPKHTFFVLLPEFNFMNLRFVATARKYRLPEKSDMGQLTILVWYQSIPSS